MRAAALAVSLGLLAALPAAATDAPIRRFAIVAGASSGPGRTPLRWATSDAREVARVLRRLGGVALDDLELLEDPDAERLRGALGAVVAEAKRARASGRRVELFVYYSGHSDEDGLLLGASRLGYADLRRLLDLVPADVRVAILDSCASGAITRAKGGVHRPPFLLDASSHVEGHAFLTSSAADEAAQESDRLRGSFFTHALLTGLRGAADASGDGVVTLNEAYQFAFRETLANTEASQAGPQHATYDIGLVGSGDVVMTDLRRADALLVVPEPLDGRVFVRNGAGQLVAELRKVRGARIELALEEGRYSVQVARDRRVLSGTFDVVASRRTVLDESRFSESPLEPTAARGPPDDIAAAVPREAAPVTSTAPFAEAAVLARGGGAASMRLRHPRGLQAELAVETWRAGFVGVEVAAGYGRMSGDAQGRLPVATWSSWAVHDDVTVVPLFLSLKLGLPGGGVRPYLAAGAGLTWVTVSRRPAADYSWAWQGSGRLSGDDMFVSLHCGAGLDIPLSHRLRATLDGRLSLGAARVLQELLSMQAVQVLAGMGYSF